MLGDDETITSIPTDIHNLFETVLQARNHDPYIRALGSASAPTSSSQAIDVAVFDDIDERNPKANPNRKLVVTKAYTVGSELWHSHSLFGRGTKVQRVILHNDLVLAAKHPEKPLRFFALKTSWRQRCRRPELDFYDLIWYMATSKSEESIALKKKLHINLDYVARCIGSIDMSLETVPNSLRPDGNVSWGTNGHRTSPWETKKTNYQRFHTRTIITPIGTPLENFKCTRDLVMGAYDGIKHLTFAHEAGVNHRDVSDGNMMFAERLSPEEIVHGLLLDWDYAEFTEAGAKKFEELWPDRFHAPNLENVHKSLKDLTGTWPFMALDILDYNRKLDIIAAGGLKHTDVKIFQHALHHDLESFFWLLVWMIFRHTKHDTPHAVQEIFGDSRTGGGKFKYLQRPSPLGRAYKLDNDGLSSVLNTFRGAVLRQNPAAVETDTAPSLQSARPVAGDESDDDGDEILQQQAVKPEIMESRNIRAIFSRHLKNENFLWNKDDEAIDLIRIGDTWTIDFKNEQSQRRLTEAILHRDFGLSVRLPLDRLCPPVSSVAEAIPPSSADHAQNKLRVVDRRRHERLWVRGAGDLRDGYWYRRVGYIPTSRVSDEYDVVLRCNRQVHPQLSGKPLIYLSFLADVDLVSIASALSNVTQNGLGSRIQIIPTTPTARVYAWLHDNPEVHEDVLASAVAKEFQPHAVCTGADVEMITLGGEVAFVLRMLTESVQLRERCSWYTSMLGKMSSLADIVAVLRSLNAISRIPNAQLQNLMPAKNVLRQPLHHSPSADDLSAILSAIEDIEVEREPGDNAFSVRATRVTWSRTARRKKKQNIIVDPAPTMTPILVCRLRLERLVLESQWVSGRSRLVFEGFTSHVGRKLVKGDQSEGAS
ncbi:unnamed protein product [Mycena citricolor]|uniref:Fungal-type protein kinase domain-containing protein n=1 Tax=Mycena citricolor TaxID=2018698 RepID=A0AAD2H6J2_9AGAR|nr:unnamed protein product [Mycena citricolor]